jgi:hypothetical protein
LNYVLQEQTGKAVSSLKVGIFFFFPFWCIFYECLLVVLGGGREGNGETGADEGENEHILFSQT